MNSMIIIKTSEQLAQFAADADAINAAIPTVANFSSWDKGNYDGWILKSRAGVFKITGYDQATGMLTIKKMSRKERLRFLLGEIKWKLVKAIKRFLRND